MCTKHVIATVIRLDEAIALVALNHFTVPMLTGVVPSQIYKS